MKPTIIEALAAAQEPFADTRFHLSRLEATSAGHKTYALRGTVLDGFTLSAITADLTTRAPGIRWDTQDVRVLRAEEPSYRTVLTNLTGFYAAPSWLGEQQGQLLYGATLEVLEEQERWVFGRLPDGYLGWAYRGYLGQTAPPTPSHMVGRAMALLSPEPGAPSSVALTRLFAGTPVTAAEVDGAWHHVTIAGGLTGYIESGALRPIGGEGLLAERRALLIHTAQREYIGVPYLWGGTTVLGIDCSGFAQLMHRLVGTDIPRDADQQFAAGQPVEPPLQAGDLVFFGAPGDHRAVSHVGISLGPEHNPGGWHIIHSSRSRNGVYVEDMQAVDHLRDRFLGARRFLVE